MLHVRIYFDGTEPGDLPDVDGCADTLADAIDVARDLLMQHATAAPVIVTISEYDPS